MSTEERSKRRPKVVYDTNVYVSAFIYGGSPWRCLELAVEKEVELITSKEILEEFAKVLEKKFGWPEEKREKAVRRIVKYAIIVEPRKRLKKISNDPTDNRMLEAAEEGRADYIVTGDKKHILPLKKHKTAKILSPADFLKVLQKRKPIV